MVSSGVLLDLTGSNTYTTTYSQLTINSGGTLMIGAAGNLGGGNFGSVYAISNSGALVFSTSSSQTLSDMITGPGSLVQNGPGTLTLNNFSSAYNGSAAYTGGTTISGGVLAYGVQNALPSTGAVTISGGTLDLEGYLANVGSLSGAGGVILNNNPGTNTQIVVSSGTYGGVVTDGQGTMGVWVAKSGSLTLTGSNSYSGLTYVQGGGTLTVGGAGVLGGGAVQVDGGGLLNFNSSATQTFSGAINLNGGTLAQNGPGLLDVIQNQSSNYGGTTTVSGGTLQFDLTGVPEYAGNRLGTISIGAGGSLSFTNTGSATDYGLIGSTTFTGNGTINKTGTGYLDFWSGTSIANFAGNINVLQGTLATNTSDWGSSAGEHEPVHRPLRRPSTSAATTSSSTSLAAAERFIQVKAGTTSPWGRKAEIPPSAARYKAGTP